MDEQQKSTADSIAGKGAGKGKGGKGKGGKGKDGKGIPAPLTRDTIYGGKGAPSFFTKEAFPLSPLPAKKQVANVDQEVTTPSADALDLGEEAFSVLGMSMREKSNEGKKTVSMVGNQAATMNKFMRTAYGCTTSR